MTKYDEFVKSRIHHVLGFKFYLTLKAFVESRFFDFLRNRQVSKKKSVTSFGLITDFVFFVFAVAMPLSTLCLAANKYLSYEEENNAYKVVNGN